MGVCPPRSWPYVILVETVGTPHPSSPLPSLEPQPGCHGSCSITSQRAWADELARRPFLPFFFQEVRGIWPRASPGQLEDKEPSGQLWLLLRRELLSGPEEPPAQVTTVSLCTGSAWCLPAPQPLASEALRLISECAKSHPLGQPDPVSAAEPSEFPAHICPVPSVLLSVCKVAHCPALPRNRPAGFDARGK